VCDCCSCSHSVLRDASEVMSGSATLTDHMAPCHGLLSHVFDDLSFRHCCSFRCSPTVIQRKLVTLCLSKPVSLFSIFGLPLYRCRFDSTFSRCWTLLCFNYEICSIFSLPISEAIFLTGDWLLVHLNHYVNYLVAEYLLNVSYEWIWSAVTLQWPQMVISVSLRLMSEMCICALCSPRCEDG